MTYTGISDSPGCNGSFSGRGINTPPPSSSQLELLSTIYILSPPLLQSSKHQDLPIPPPKLVDLWRIEGEDLDLHLHRAVSPLSEWNPFDLVLEVPFVVFFFVLPLLSPHKHLLLLVGFGSEGLDHFLCSCLCFCA